MKTIILIVLLFLSLSTFGQDLNLFNHNQEIVWIKEGYQNIDEATLDKIFPVIKGKPYRELSAAKEEIDKFHYVDLNKDGTDEILYNGWTGGEGEMIQILKKINDEYKLEQQIVGRIIQLNKGNNWINFVVLDYACCAGYVDHLTYFKFDETKQKYIISVDYAKISGKLDNLQMIEPIKFVVQRDIYNMRFSPEIKENLDPNNYPFDLIQNQNISAIFKKGDTGIALAEKTDDTGRVWWLVVMDVAPKYPDTIFYQGNNDYENYKPIGWMSSRYLELK